MLDTIVTKQNIKAAALLILIGLVGVLVMWTLQTYPLRLSYTPEPYTELYFIDHENLPKNIEADRQYDFGFTIENHEQKEIVYEYLVTIVNSQGTLELSKGNAPVRHGESITVRQFFSISGEDEHSVITVQLLNREEITHFSTET